MHAPSSHSRHHHFRFYVVLTTLVVGGIFMLLLVNNNGDGVSFTSAVVGGSEDTTNVAAEADSGENVDQGGLVADIFAPEDDVDTPAKKVSSNKRVAMNLLYSSVPQFKEDARVSTMDIVFQDTASPIFVNGDKLELSNMEEVELSLQGFSGTIDFLGKGVSLQGNVQRLEVNNVALSSDSEIVLEINDLFYSRLSIDEIELQGLDLDAGDGKLSVAEQLQYTLDDEDITIDTFEGEFVVDKGEKYPLSLNGDAQGLRVSGGILDLTLG